MKKSIYLSLLFLITACSSAPKHANSPYPYDTNKINDVVIYAMSLADTPYRYGGNTSEEGFDCSGFVGHVFKQEMNVSLPRTSTEMSRQGRALAENDLQPGDLVFFNTRARPYSHVGIYVGEGKFIHSPKTGSRIRVDAMKGYWINRYNGARRIY